MKTLGSILQLTYEYFKEKKIERSRRTAEDLLAHVLNLSRMELYMQHDKPLLESEINAYRELVKRKMKGEPLEYLLGKVNFYHCSLRLSQDVLIPRPETEILIDKVCAHLKKQTLSGKSAWDVCTGSGCLGIALKKALPELEVTLADVSASALDLARANAALNRVQVSSLQGDLLAPFEGKRADIVLCNPPYVSIKEYDQLDQSVRGFEPKIALIGGFDGLLFYERMSRDLPHYLEPGASVFFEIGTGQGEAMQRLFSASCWRNQVVEKDWAGHDRFFFLEFE